MDLERWERLKAVFATLLELPLEERGARLAATLPDDPSLVAEVEDLLAAHGDAGDFYDRGALAVPEVRQKLDEVGPGTRLGPYRVLRELGRGGMGAVYLAERDEPGFHQQVAIKLIKRGMDTDEIVRRFRAERQILASLSHPNIARLLDGGSAPDGRSYFVMELIEGRPITAFAEAGGFDVEARLGLFLKVAAAVQSAHQSLVVHRDLKPANVLVDAAGEPKLLDFGIAKLLDPAGTRTALTGARRGPMTPDYASPEQRDGRPVTTATDVYSLGILLYELLVGLSPAAVERRLGAGWAERPPSQAVRALADPRDGDKRRLAHRVAGDLDTIIGKALEMEPERRYGTAAAFAEDVQRHLTQRPVLARRPTLAYRLGRTVVRHKLVAALALGICLLAITATAAAIALYQAKKEVETQRRTSETANEIMSELLKAGPGQRRGESRIVRRLLNQDPSLQKATMAPLFEKIGRTYSDLGLYAKAEECLRRALVLREAQRESGHDADLTLAGNLTALGDATREIEKYEDSQRSYERALELKEQRLEDDELPLAEDLNGLGLVALAQGRYKEAHAAFERARAIGRQAGDEGEKALAIALNNLGTLAAAQGQFTKARLIFGAIYRYQRMLSGDDDPDTLEHENNLAFALTNLGDDARAELLYRDIADRRRRLLGIDHPDFVASLLPLVIVQRKLGRLREARANLEEILKIRGAYGLPHDETEAETWNMLGSISADQGDLEIAGSAYAQSYEFYRALAGDHRRDMANVLQRKARVRQRQGDLAGAIALVRQSVAVLGPAPGLEPLDSSSSRQLLAELLRQARPATPSSVPPSIPH